MLAIWKALMEDPLRQRLKQQRQSWIELREVATPSASLPSRKQLSVPRYPSPSRHSGSGAVVHDTDGTGDN